MRGALIIAFKNAPSARRNAYAATNAQIAIKAEIKHGALLYGCFISDALHPKAVRRKDGTSAVASKLLLDCGLSLS
jgi:hypothetical protein